MVWLSKELIPIRQFRSADGLHELVVFRRPDGLFGFQGERLTTERDDTFWTPSDGSGIYETAEAAERAAVAEIPWLRNNNSN